MHPYTLSLFNQLIRVLGGFVTVVNPYLHLTKGEVCRRALEAGLPSATLTQATVSCGHPPRDRPELHCGHCYPCLVRRSGILATSSSDDTPYGKDVWAIGDDLAASADRRALRRWLTYPFGVRDLITDMPVPDTADLAPLVDVVRRGRVELENMFRQHGQPVAQAKG
ncbi:7-cyano-7-deazaguanine synthase [Micromonospora sp. NPDC050495]|uniref:7-cyano-7-deazaguanine synthase n=1 Tax=Micromonospora sp. NPDC050495 TaxID=3154936 RepID=UPI0033D3B2A3